jgi:hypothetical protein
MPRCHGSREKRGLFHMRKLGLGLGLTVRALDIFFFMADINQSPLPPYGTLIIPSFGVQDGSGLVSSLIMKNGHEHRT